MEGTKRTISTEGASHRRQAKVGHAIKAEGFVSPTHIEWNHCLGRAHQQNRSQFVSQTFPPLLLSRADRDKLGRPGNLDAQRWIGLRSRWMLKRKRHGGQEHPRPDTLAPILAIAENGRVELLRTMPSKLVSAASRRIEMQGAANRDFRDEFEAAVGRREVAPKVEGKLSHKF